MGGPCPSTDHDCGIVDILVVGLGLEVGQGGSAGRGERHHLGVTGELDELLRMQLGTRQLDHLLMRALRCAGLSAYIDPIYLNSLLYISALRPFIIA